MVDSVSIFPPGERLTDASGVVVPLGTIEIYQAGTTTPRTVYSDTGLSSALGTVLYTDSGGYVVASSGSTTKVIAYTGTGAYKMVAKDTNGSTLWTHDNIGGALDTSGFDVTSAYPTIPVVSAWPSSFDNPFFYNGNVSGGSEVKSLPSAVTKGDGYLCGFRHNAPGSSNTLTAQAIGGQTIKDGASAAINALTLTGYGESVLLLSDGTAWTVISKTAPLIKSGTIKIVSRLTAAPASPTAGARYLISGTPTSTWLTLGFAEKDIAEADGIGGWIKYTPPTDCGWIAYVQGENLNYQFQDSAWVALSNITAPAVDYQRKSVFQYQLSNGTAGPTTTAGSRQTYPINTYVNTGAANAISGATLTTNTISGLPVGWYELTGSAFFNSVDSVQMWLYNSTTATDVLIGNVSSMGNATAFRGEVSLRGSFQVTDAAHNYIIHYRTATAGGSSATGIASTFSDGVEVYATFILTQLATQQGPIGATGATGATGRDAGHGRWAWSTTTTSGPSSGTIRANNATFASQTELYIHETDADSRALAAQIATWDDSTSTIKGTLLLTKQDTPGVFAQYQVTALTDNGSDVTLAVTPLVAGTAFSAADSVNVLFVRAGDAGSGGGGGGIALYDGAASISSGTARFSNSNGITFGISGQTVTASHNGLTSQSNQAVSGANGSFTFQTLTLANSNGVSWSTGTQGLYATVATNYLTTAALSNHSHGNPTLALTNLSGTTASNSAGLTLSLSAAAGGGGADGYNILAAGSQTAGTAGSVLFQNSNGITFGMSNSSVITASHNGLTTARASTDGIGLATAQSNVTWTVNSAGLSFDARGYAGTATAVTGGASLTVNSAGVSFNGSGLAGTATAITGGAAITLNSAGLSFNGSALAGTATTFNGTNVSGSMTLNTAGLRLDLSAAAGGGGGGDAVASYFDNFFFTNASIAPLPSRTFMQPVMMQQAVSASYARLLLTLATNSASFATTANTSFSGSMMSTWNINFYTQMTGASSQSLGLYASGSAGMTQQVSLEANANGSQYTVFQNVTYPFEGGTSSYSTSVGVTNASFQLSSQSITLFTGPRYYDIPFATSLPASNYWVGIGMSSSSATQGTADITGLRVSGSIFGISAVAASFAPMGSATTNTYHHRPGVGAFTGALGVGNVPFSSISINVGNPMPAFQLHGVNYP